MATLIRATCRDCGDVELGTRDLVVRVCEESDRGSYVFRCPECTAPVAHDADGPTVELLVASGCRLERWHLPAELGEPRPGGGTFTHDDLIELHDLLEEPGWFADLLRTRGSDG